MDAPGTRHPSTRVRRLLPWIALAVLLVPTGARVRALVQPFTAPGWERLAFYDFRLWRSGVARFEQTGVLYDTEQPGYFLPGSQSRYKYPPTYAALLKLVSSQPQRLVGRAFFLGNVLILAAFLAMLLWALRPAAWRAVLMILLFFHWQPFFENFGDLQMEPILLFCLGLALVMRLRARELSSGIPLGVAGAFKVYPWILLLEPAARRRWRVLAGGAIGALGTLLFAGIVLPPRLSVQFFFSVLPRIGGTSLSYENVSLLATLGRCLLQLTGRLPSPEALDGMVLETSAASAAMRVAQVLALLVAAALLYVTVQAARRARSAPVHIRETALLSMSICLLLLFIPTSWLPYQVLLALPLLSAAALAPPWAADRSAWRLLGFGAAWGVIFNDYGTFFASFPGTPSLLRALVPLAIWGSHLRILGVSRPTAS
jgi:hypothetical protein